MQQPILRYIISLDDARKMIKAMNKKKNRDHGYEFQYDDLGTLGEAAAVGNVLGVDWYSTDERYRRHRGSFGYLQVWRSVVVNT